MPTIHPSPQRHLRRLLLFLVPVSLLLGSRKVLPVPLYGVECISLGLVILLVCKIGYRSLLSVPLPKAVQLAGTAIAIGVLTGLIHAWSHTEGINAFKSWFALPVLLGISLLAFWQHEPDEQTGDHTSLAAGILTFASLETLYGLCGLLLGRYTEGRLAGTFLSPNAYAAACMPALVLAGVLWTRFPRWRLPLGLVVVLLTIGLVLSKSLGGLLGMAIVVIVVGIRASSPRLRLAVLGIVMSIVAISGVYARTRFQTFGGSSLDSRIQIWRTAVTLVGDNTLSGTGLRSFSHYYPQRVHQLYPQQFRVVEENVPEPHNLYLAWWLDLGLFGFLGFVGLAGTLLSRPRATKGWELVLIAILGHGLVDTPFFWLELAVLFWLYSTVLVALLITPSHRDKSS